MGAPDDRDTAYAEGYRDGMNGEPPMRLVNLGNRSAPPHERDCEDHWTELECRIYRRGIEEGRAVAEKEHQLKEKHENQTSAGRRILDASPSYQKAVQEIANTVTQIAGTLLEHTKKLDDLGSGVYGQVWDAGYNAGQRMAEMGEVGERRTPKRSGTGTGYPVAYGEPMPDAEQVLGDEGSLGDEGTEQGSEGLGEGQNGQAPQTHADSWVSRVDRLEQRITAVEQQAEDAQAEQADRDREAGWQGRRQWEEQGGIDGTEREEEGV